MNPQDLRAPNSQQRWIEIYNVGSQVIPAFGVVEVSDASMPEGAAGPTRYHAKRPTKDELENFFVNSFLPVSNTGAVMRGFATNDFPAIVLYDDSGSAPQPGEIWGPQKDSFAIAKGKRGLLILGHVDTTNKWVRVLRIGVADKIRRFQLLEDLNPGGSAAVKFRRWNPTLNGGDGGFEDDPAGEGVVHDWWGQSDGGVEEPSRGMWQGKEGMEGWCRQRGEGAPDTDFDLIWMETYAWSHEGETTEAIDKSGDVWKVEAQTKRAYEQGQLPETTITLRDYQQLYPHVLTGAKTLAARSEYDADEEPGENEEDDPISTPVNPSYHLWVAQQMGFLCTATLEEDMCDTGDYSISGVTVATFSPFNLEPPSLSKCKNPRRHMGEKGDEVTLIYHHGKDTNGSRDWFEVIDVTKKKVKYHQIRWNASAKCFEFREHEVAVEYCKPIDESEWLPLVCANPCPSST